MVDRLAFKIGAILGPHSGIGWKRLLDGGPREQVSRKAGPNPTTEHGQSEFPWPS